MRHMKHGEDAEEVVQDVLMNVGALRSGAALSSWIYCIISNSAMSRLPAAGADRRTRRNSSQDPGVDTPTRREAAEGHAARGG